VYHLVGTLLTEILGPPIKLVSGSLDNAQPNKAACIDIIAYSDI